MNVDVVVPTIGRRSLGALLDALDRGSTRFDGRVIVVDDRDARDTPLPDPPRSLRDRVDVLTAGGRGPAGARNIGWRASRADWIAFLDDDVVPDAEWCRNLIDDLTAVDVRHDVAASQGRIVVPLPGDRRPTSWERDVAGLEAAEYITADIAYRRSALAQVGGFDEYFTGAYREDADLAVRTRSAGHDIVRGRRTSVHPVRIAPWHVSIRRQRGNAADARMRAKYGASWRAAARAPRGRLPLHAIATAALGLAAGATFARSRRTAAVGLACWGALTVEFTVARLRRGAWTLEEVATVLVTSVVIPPVAVWHRLCGEVRERTRVRAALLDRDGTLVVDVPYNGDPERVVPMPAAASALARLRAHGIRLGVVTNQSGIARGLIDRVAVRRVNARVDALLGPIEHWAHCPHDADDNCDCRKPRPAMVRAAARTLGVPIRRCVVIGDTIADVGAAAAAGCRGILVPNSATRAEEVASAREVAADLDAAVDLVLGIAR
jgi:histidinol-phosphate phosphatase family protein